ncbi:MAG TPA: hypothetical protein VJ770_21250 [Stellaceae bacterium]|nr:hypothetical protein [Stellaceae bacterium]
MNRDHVVAGTAGVSTTAMLATVLAHFQNVPSDVATAEAGLAVLALGAMAGLAQALIGRPPDLREAPNAAKGP